MRISFEEEIASAIEALHNAVSVSVCLSLRENNLYSEPQRRYNEEGGLQYWKVAPFWTPEVSDGVLRNCPRSPLVGWLVG